MSQHTLTLKLPEQYNAALEELAKAQDMSKTAVMRAALRLYQVVHYRVKAGETMAFVDKDGNLVKQEIIGCGH